MENIFYAKAVIKIQVKVKDKFSHVILQVQFCDTLSKTVLTDVASEVVEILSPCKKLSNESVHHYHNVSKQASPLCALGCSEVEVGFDHKIGM